MRESDSEGDPKSAGEIVRARHDNPGAERVSADDSERRRGLRFLEWSLRLIAMVLGLCQALATRQTIDGDVISYLDMATAVFRMDSSTLITGSWNPLYAVLLSPVVYLTRDSPALEYPAVHAVTFIFYLAALFAFGFFLRELLLLEEAAAFGPGHVSRKTWMILGYALFTWSSLDLIQVSETNPDMLVAALVYLATGLLIRARRRPSLWRPYALLGLTLGLAYLTKSFMFVGALIFIGVAAVALSRSRRAVARIGVAALVLVFVSGPFIIALSLQKRRLTFGESGRLNYAWHVNGVKTRNWQGGPPEAGNPVHPTRRVLGSPAVYEFSRPIPVTYPLWHDPSYWYEGVRIVVRPLEQARALTRNLFHVCSYCFGLQGAFAVGLLILLLLGPQWGQVGRWIEAHWYVITPSLVAVGLYALVHTEPRYLGAFLTITYLSLFMAVTTGTLHRGGGAVIRGLAPAAWIILMLPSSVTGGAARFYSALSNPGSGLEGRRPDSEALKATSALGLKPGDKVATTEFANHGVVCWARLARVQIVAEVRSFESGKKDFWELSEEEQDLAFAAVARAGAKAIASDSRPRGNPRIRWNRLGPTDYYLHFLGGDDAASSVGAR